MRITLYSDGSCLGNPGPGGYGIVLTMNKHRKEISGSQKDTTNNQMELLAVIIGLESIKKRDLPIHIVSDSQYVLKAINEWLANWIKKDFAKVKNVDLWKRYVIASSGLTITTEWVKGHAGHEENEVCDRLAFNAATKLKESLI